MQEIYTIPREILNSRQKQATTYHDKIVYDDMLKVGEQLYVYLPRNKQLKSISNLYGPVDVSFANQLCIRCLLYIMLFKFVLLGA